MLIEVYADVICPWCLIGGRRLRRALVSLSDVPVTLAWRVFQLNPDMPPGGMDRQRYLETKFGGPEKARQVYGHILKVGQADGIEFRFADIRRTPNTLNAHRLIQLAATQDRADQLVELLYESYFQHGLDLGDARVLEQLGEAVGFSRADVRKLLESDLGIEEARRDDLRARQMGIRGVPTFVFNGRHVLSGAHPPEVLERMIELAMADLEEMEASG